MKYVPLIIMWLVPLVVAKYEFVNVPDEAKGFPTFAIVIVIAIATTYYVRAIR